MKVVTIYNPAGEILRTFPVVLAHNTENGLLAFRFEAKPGDRTTITKIITNLPFLMEDDTA